MVTNSSTSATDDSVQTPVDSSHDSKASAASRPDGSKDASKKKRLHGKSKSKKSNAKADDASRLSDADNDSDSDSDSDADSDASNAEALKKPKKDKNSSKKQPTKTKKKSKQKQKSKPVDSDSDSSDDDTSDSSDSDVEEKEVDDSQQNTIDELQALKLQMSQLQAQLQPNPASGFAPGAPGIAYPNGGFGAVNMGFASNGFLYGNPMAVPQGVHLPPPIPNRPNSLRLTGGPRGLAAHRKLEISLGDKDPLDEEKPNSKKVPKKLEFKRVDWVWDDGSHRWKLQDSTDDGQDSRYDGYIFHVRRVFDWEGKYRSTYVDIKSKLLRECLKDVIGDVPGVSLVEEKPKLDPNFLFLYLEDLREHRHALKSVLPAGDSRKERKKNQKRLDDKRAHLKILLKYLDHDYAAIKKSLYPMLESGIITFEYLWALWKPNTLVYMTTYGTPSEPRAFRVEMAVPRQSLMKGNYYSIEGKYFEYDGKKFGYGSLEEEIPEFTGAQKITSLPCYPLKYHRDEARIRTELIERGKKFVSLAGVHYKSYQGIAFMKRKKHQIIKFHIQQSRIMVDSTNFRRINPNYNVSHVRPKDHDILYDSDGSDSEGGGCCDCSDSDSDSGKKTKYVTKAFKTKDGQISFATVSKDELNEEIPQQNLAALPDRKGSDTEGDESDDEETAFTFTDEEFLLASSVVLGFSFSEKQWLEFPVSKIENITWNDKAWDSLVLDIGTKDLIKALVESRKFQASKTIDDVIQGKGKGLVTVLHGPPGTGKTLTAEGISELLKCPLYMVSAGELGTDPRFLEAELQKILDICHAWGAILLLDEADVFLEKRDMHNIHRNALVSIFLRQLEYFQGILFLTTNRVETFDEAFQSRIHIALRYDQLDTKAKRAIFKMFLNRVKTLGKLEVEPLTEDEYTFLSKKELNGREIKNVVGSAQDLAVHKGEALSMRHIKHVLDVHTKFGRDLRGGSGYEDAMRSYS
ncbi:hypothetical protein B0T10DRAFT_404876 [Thelonectria olida]|uniref:AAA+ ATPase domain-containing protein n=1 Tax=Thelonectria olida TaxID=1576542 RepID=A0A9P9AQ35_9HYPO|nr:hypothetical protein B0T10DRAFT_404876 [Thelonectria olida]